jgi:GNAT superfamily N-acetyltransferase
VTVIDRAALVARIARTWALDAAAHARVLATQDPSWGTEVFDLAGGQAVLCGPGLYVNRALAVGLAGPVNGDDFDRLEERSAVVGVAPSVDVVPTADRRVTELAAARGYAVLRFITTHVRPPVSGGDASPAEPSIVIERADGELLGAWQDVAAVGFGVDEGQARRASDAFARAAAVVDGDGFLLARDADDGRPLGCGTVTIRDGLATLRGMTTLPSERGRGVQAALIAHRLRLAAEAGCDLAVSSTLPANASERNLVRAGFRPLYETVTLAREPRASGSS